MEYYKIIHDEQALREFINWLPDLEINEIYYLSLFARKKYCPDIIRTNDKLQLKRFTATKENMFNKISQLEIPVGRYLTRKVVVPQESLVLYIHTNPRNMKKATEGMGKTCWDLMKNQNYNLHQEAMSCIQKSKSRTKYIVIDIDTKDVNFENLKTILPTGCYYTIETRGGYHLLIDPVMVNKYNYGLVPKNWYSVVTFMYKDVIDQKGDVMSPVPGTIQGGFIPNLKYY